MPARCRARPAHEASQPPARCGRAGGRPAAGRRGGAPSYARDRGAGKGRPEQPRRVVGMRGLRHEAVPGERSHQLTPRERVLVERAAGGGHGAGATADPGGAETPGAVEIGHRDDEDPARREHSAGLGQDRVGAVGIVLDDAEGDVGGHGATADRQRPQVARRQGHRRGPVGGGERGDTAIHAGRAPATLAQEDDVLPEPAAGLEHDALTRQRRRDQVRERRHGGDRQQLVHRVAAPVLRPEIFVHSGGVVREHSASGLRKPAAVQRRPAPQAHSRARTRRNEKPTGMALSLDTPRPRRGDSRVGISSTRSRSWSARMDIWYSMAYP